MFVSNFLIYTFEMNLYNASETLDCKYMNKNLNINMLCEIKQWVNLNLRCKVLPKKMSIMGCYCLNRKLKKK